MDKKMLKEQVRIVAQKKITESVSGKKEQLNEFVDPLSLAVGAVSGVAVFYMGLMAKRKFDTIMRGIGNFFKDPLSGKKRTMDSMMGDLRRLIENRDKILHRGEAVSIAELREAEYITKSISTMSAQIRDFVNANMEALNLDQNREGFVELMGILNSASSGDITFIELKNPREVKQKGILAAIFGT